MTQRQAPKTDGGGARRAFVCVGLLRHFLFSREVDSSSSEASQSSGGRKIAHKEATTGFPARHGQRRQHPREGAPRSHSFSCTTSQVFRGFCSFLVLFWAPPPFVRTGGSHGSTTLKGARDRTGGGHFSLSFLSLRTSRGARRERTGYSVLVQMLWGRLAGGGGDGSGTREESSPWPRPPTTRCRGSRVWLARSHKACQV